MNNYFFADNLYKKQGTFTVHFSVAAEKGTMTVLVGPSGSGKSTVLRLIAGLEQSDTEKSINDENKTLVFLAGENITNIAPGKRHIGMVFQSHALFAHLRVNDNVGYGLRCAGMSISESRRKAEAYLENFGLAGFGKRWPETLSGGEAQRVSLARTLILEPRLVLFDEPLSALDAPLRKKLATDIRMRQQRTGFTGIWVTHDITEAEMIADKIILLENGKKKWEGVPRDFTEGMMESGK
jgi:ABC-type Fe3+/spermidine/putrescine transport system ATPase subunit